MADTSPGGLSDDELGRYARHLVLREVGGAGQAKLRRARVLVVGLGGLGAPLALYLAAAGIGTLGLVDPDRVALSNLQRQVLFRTGDIGRLKVEAARETLLALNPGVAIELHPFAFDADNGPALAAGYDLVTDGSDNGPTRQAVNRACVAAERTLVSGAVSRFSGQVATFKGHLGPPEPCYRCFAGDDEGPGDDCAALGILGAVAGTIGSLQAIEVCKELLGIGESLAGRLLLYDALDARTQLIRLRRDPHCPVCGPGAN